MNRNVKRPKLSRKERLTRKYKSCVRCEWCNRWTVIPLKKWYRLKQDDVLFPAKYTYYCPRGNCKRDRAEYLPS